MHTRVYEYKGLYNIAYKPKYINVYIIASPPVCAA